MSGSFTAMPRCLLFLSTLLSVASAATLTAEQHAPLMRRSVEADSFSNTVQLGGSGEVIKLQGSAPALNQQDDEDAEERGVQMCNYDYVAGGDASDNCTKSSHDHILESEMCIEAARKLKIPTLGFDAGYFTERPDWYKHPRGCYLGKCGKPGGKCIFFNSAPMFPKDKIEGKPVCRRARLVNGTNNADGTKSDESCPEDYRVIMDRDYCSEAADCLGYCTGTYFLIGESNRTQHDLFPQGCFIHPVEGCVYMNPARPARDGSPWVPGQPSGMPICTAKNPAGGDPKPPPAKAAPPADAAAAPPA